MKEVKMSKKEWFDCMKCSSYSRLTGRCGNGKINPRTLKEAKDASQCMGLGYICNKNQMATKLLDLLTKELTEKELALMAKIGLSLNDINKANKKPREKREAPPLVNLEGFSGVMVMTCHCCGNKDKKFIDYVKRADAPGFAIKVVTTPTHAVTREHVSTVVTCSLCKDAMLSLCDKEHLIKMVINLRDYIRRGIGR